jgi:hypothetical protein
MRILPIILLQLFSSLLFGQRCETIGGKVINCIDKDSLKQGFWYEYNIDKILTTDSFNRNPGAIGFHNDEGKVYTPVAEGFYKDNKRIGTWTYYVGFYNDPDAHEKTVLFTDSGFRYEIDSFYHYTFRISDDTSSLSGKLFLKKDTIDVVCKDRKCKLYNPFRKKTEKVKWTALDGYIRYLNFNSFKVKQEKNGS